MPTYATADDAAAYIAGLEVDDAPAFDRLLERAERDVDRLVGPYRPHVATGLKLDPAWVEGRFGPWARRALASAVCAQVEYLLTAGEAAFVEGERLPSLVAGPDFQKSYGSGATRATIGPRVGQELEPLLRLLVPRTARARP